LISAAATYAELWVSLASLLRSYTAAHGLNKSQQATVELGENQITVRTGDRWLSLNRQQDQILWTREDSAQGRFRFTIEGRLQTEEGQEQEMDIQAEAWARELMK
jgi:hypothetical protein